MIAGGFDPKLESENADFDNEDRTIGATTSASYDPRIESENADRVDNQFKLTRLVEP